MLKGQPQGVLVRRWSPGGGGVLRSLEHPVERVYENSIQCPYLAFWLAVSQTTLHMSPSRSPSANVPPSPEAQSKRAAGLGQEPFTT